MAKGKDNIISGALNYTYTQLKEAACREGQLRINKLLMNNPTNIARKEADALRSKLNKKPLNCNIPKNTQTNVNTQAHGGGMKTQAEAEKKTIKEIVEEHKREFKKKRTSKELQEYYDNIINVPNKKKKNQNLTQAYNIRFNKLKKQEEENAEILTWSKTVSIVNDINHSLKSHLAGRAQKNKEPKNVYINADGTNSNEEQAKEIINNANNIVKGLLNKNKVDKDLREIYEQRFEKDSLFIKYHNIYSKPYKLVLIISGNTIKILSVIPEYGPVR